MNLNGFLQALFSHGTTANRRGAQLEQSQQLLKGAFSGFAKNLASQHADAEFFGRSVQVDLSALDKNVVTLKVFGADEIWLAFGLKQSDSGAKGTVTCNYVHGWELAKLGAQARLRLLGSWEFDQNGDTNITLGGGGPLNMKAGGEAVALAVGVVLAAYSVKDVEESKSAAFGTAGIDLTGRTRIRP